MVVEIEIVVVVVVEIITVELYAAALHTLKVNSSTKLSEGVGCKVTIVTHPL